MGRVAVAPEAGRVADPQRCLPSAHGPEQRRGLLSAAWRHARLGESRRDPAAGVRGHLVAVERSGREAPPVLKAVELKRNVQPFASRRSATWRPENDHVIERRPVHVDGRSHRQHDSLERFEIRASVTAHSIVTGRVAVEPAVENAVSSLRHLVHGPRVPSREDPEDQRERDQCVHRQSGEHGEEVGLRLLQDQDQVAVRLGLSEPDPEIAIRSAVHVTINSPAVPGRLDPPLAPRSRYGSGHSPMRSRTKAAFSADRQKVTTVLPSGHSRVTSVSPVRVPR